MSAAPSEGPAGTRRQVGFIGLGVMGYPMAGHLAAAGLGLTCFDTDPAMRDRMRDTWPAAGVADDVAAVGAGSDIVITMLPDGERVRQVALDAGGLIDSMAAGSILLDCSSAQPWLTLGDGACARRQRRHDGRRARCRVRSGAPKPPSSCSWSAARTTTSNGCARCSTCSGGQRSTSVRSARVT